MSAPSPPFLSICPCRSCVRYKSYNVSRAPPNRLFQCNIVTLVTVLTSVSPIHFSHHDINAPKNHHHVGDGVPETKVFQHRQVDETWRTHTVAIGIRPAVTD